MRSTGLQAEVEKMWAVGGEMDRALELRTEIVRGLKETGFQYITLDLEGYRTGSMNEAL